MTDRPRSWQEMRARIEELLERRTGEGVDAWNRRVAGSGAGDEAALRGLARAGEGAPPVSLPKNARSAHVFENSASSLARTGARILPPAPRAGATPA